MKQNPKWRPRVGLIAVAALGVLGGTSLALADSQPGSAPPAVPVAQSVSPDQLHNYGALRTGPAGDVPASVKALALDPEFRHWGANPALAGSVSRHGSRSDIWYVVPGTNSLCFYVARDGNGVCGEIARADAGALIAWGAYMGPDNRIDPSRGAQAVRGIMPDSITAVTALTATGDVPAELDQNTLEVHAEGITGLRLQDRSGAATVVEIPH
jgi:hypothetical protein